MSAYGLGYPNPYRIAKLKWIKMTLVLDGLSDIVGTDYVELWLMGKTSFQSPTSLLLIHVISIWQVQLQLSKLMK